MADTASRKILAATEHGSKPASAAASFAASFTNRVARLAHQLAANLDQVAATHGASRSADGALIGLDIERLFVVHGARSQKPEDSAFGLGPSQS
jgi:hypothetical protein